jgi:hypothetical protein
MLAGGTKLIQRAEVSQALVAHACNPSYSGGRDQEDRSPKPAWANFLRPYLKKPYHKIKVWQSS